ncbi:MAG: ferrous iron transport protein A [Firmicutes bacterium]|nr:ferrous iron transport protein A [Bacillota bacterium]
MELAVVNNIIKSRYHNKKLSLVSERPNLSEAVINVPYIIKEVNTTDQNMKDFLFTLGCYEGETVTVISVLADNYVISVKDARYSIDKDLARTILV